MSVQPVNSNQIETKRNIQMPQSSSNVAFGSGCNPVITLMDAIDRGGFAASFLTQDFLGTVTPRVGSGLYRNHDKTGKLNWDFAKKEAAREILSGPSAFLIPLGMLTIIKKFGSANNVPIDFIHAFGDTFEEFARNNAELIKTSPDKAKLSYYKEVYKNLLSTSTNGNLKGAELEEKAEKFAQKTFDIEHAPKKGGFKNFRGVKVKGSKQDLTSELLHEFVNIKKQHMGSDGDKVIAEYNLKGKNIKTPFKRLLNNLGDYSNDAIGHSKKILESGKNNVSDYIKEMTKSRSATRFLTNFSMFGAVVLFYTIIPKLYNSVTKGRDPGLDGLNVDNTSMDIKHPETKRNKQKPDSAKSNQTSFTGLGSAMSKMGDEIVGHKHVKKLSDIFEFNGATMSVPAMLSLMFGACLPPRLIHAQSNTDRAEILLRDILSFVSILFGAKALNRSFSNMFSKISGMALNIKPENNHGFKKFLNYFSEKGIQVLDSDRIIANYSGVENFKNGITDMFTFVQTHGGDVGKMLGLKEFVKDAEVILGKKPQKGMKLDEIIQAFDKAKGTKEYENIINILKQPDNAVVKRAKTYNSTFNFLSTILLIPGMMIAISKTCEHMTKKRIEKQKRLSLESIAQNTPVPEAMQIVTKKPTMAGFLGLGETST